VDFVPPPIAGTKKGEEHVASLFFDSNDAGQPRDEVFLRGWHAREYENNVEPSRAEIVSTIGFMTDVGRGLPKDDVNAGEEMRGSGYFRKATAGRPVVLFPLARYSSRTTGDSGATFWFNRGNPGGRQKLYNFLGCHCADAMVPTSSGGENQKLVPTPSGGVTFNPAGEFGISLFASDADMYSDDLLNGETHGHNFRFWPAHDRDGSIIPNTWIVGNDLGVDAASLPTKNWDYQDFMWVLSNATPA
jgi:hypothetical protein